MDGVADCESTAYKIDNNIYMGGIQSPFVKKERKKTRGEWIVGIIPEFRD